ncbi:MAG: CoA-binding protein [Saprospiraceae bacterium]|jgi:predicted CoA-binding protein|nr:CoA-binding protein [Saprospiraceae bacterium]MDC3210176.1 CoA-binding protein [Saprospiraceae bacterium]MDG1435140.1 CoA-binding protein [Saprospiraceae bacterium]MDG2419996.1 CoA-binding protein [Saprospiraceae bacterium]
MKKTLVLGASTKTDRYGNISTRRLKLYNHEVIPVGHRAGIIDGIDILLGKPDVDGIDTITLYLNPKRQVEFYDYIIGLKPKRIIFNPGTENPELVKLANENGIKAEIACTLVLLSTGQY